MGFSTSLIVASAILSIAQATILLSPDQDIVLPSSALASNPLILLGANSPYFAGLFSPTVRIELQGI
jgi:hypothetical protein